MKLIDKNIMIKPIKNKIIKVLSNGCLNLSFNYFLNAKQIKINKKDNKNFILNKKLSINTNNTKEFLNYKKKYLI